MAAAPLASLLPRGVLGAETGARRTLRRVRRSALEWPSPASWDALRREVGGNLIEVEPLLAPCTPRLPGRDCLARLEDLRNPLFLGDHLAGTQVSGWLDAWKPAPSAYAVRARNAAGVAAAVRFARDHRLRFVVKDGGHSYQGTSSAPDSLLVWTRAMNRIQLHDAFVAQSCTGQEPVSAVTIEAGAIWIDAYDAVTTKAGRYVQGGGCATVGVAGLVQSGGFGSLSKRFGTAAGSLLEAEVVTADGVVRTVNPCNDPDLFWALKGGGGTFGIVTRLTLRTHELPDRIGYVGGTIQARSADAMRELIARFLAFYADALLNPRGARSSGSVRTTRSGSRWCARVSSARRSRRSGVRSSTGSGLRRSTRPPTRGRRAGERLPLRVRFALAAGRAARARRARAARRRALRGEPALAGRAALQQGARRRAGRGRRRRARHRDQPRRARRLRARDHRERAGPPLDWLPLYSSWARSRARDVDAAAAELRKIVPDAGSYVSESSYFNASWQTAFWGANYSRLREVKTRYDPDGLFFVHHGVGSEEWSADGFERLRDHLP